MIPAIGPVEILMILVAVAVFFALLTLALGGEKQSSTSRRKQHIRSTGQRARSEMDRVSGEFRRTMRK